MTLNFMTFDLQPLIGDIDHAVSRIDGYVKGQSGGLKSRDQFAIVMMEIVNISELVHGFSSKQVADGLKIINDFMNNHFASVLKSDDNQAPLCMTYYNNMVSCLRVNGGAHAHKLMKDVITALNMHCDKNDFKPYFAIEFGVALIENGNVYQAWTEAATALAKSIKHSSIGSNINIFDSKNSTFAQYRNDIEIMSYFRHCFFNGQLSLAYQPIVDAKTFEVDNYECLLRVKTPEGDFLSAGTFIKIAERFGFINYIDDMMLSLVVDKLKEYPDVCLSMNVSNMTAYDDAWLEKARRIITPDVAKRLTMEITETGSFDKLITIRKLVQGLQELGCTVAVDDFGAGNNTSLLHIQVLKPDIIKIDGNFVRNIENNPNNHLFVKTMVKLINSIGYKSVMEFVETSQDADIVIGLGADFLQGHLICQALNYEPWLIKDIDYRYK